MKVTRFSQKFPERYIYTKLKILPRIDGMSSVCGLSMRRNMYPRQPLHV